MKKSKTRTLKLSKISVAVVQALEIKTLNGGTEPVSRNLMPPMTQAPDEDTICYAVR